jgi:tyrosinase
MHHGNVDRIFWMWQQKDLETRLNQVGGPVKAYDYSGTNVTLDFTINIGKLAVDATLKDLLNTEGGTLCYTY